MKTEQENRNMKMFGVADIDKWFDEAVTNTPILDREQSIKMIAMSMLSDVQEEINMGLTDTARKHINIAKWIISTKL